MLDVRQTLFDDAVFYDQILQLLTVCVTFYRLRNDAETIQMNLLVLRVLLVVSKTSIKGYLKLKF